MAHIAGNSDSKMFIYSMPVNHPSVSVSSPGNNTLHQGGSEDFSLRLYYTILHSGVRGNLGDKITPFHLFISLGRRVLVHFM